MKQPPKERLYKEIADRLIVDFAGGKYKTGDRLPTERELASEYDVSRPTIREAVIALEVQGIVEVRLGSGAYFREMPETANKSGFDISGFELTEARLLLEGEAAALAAAEITDEEIETLEGLVNEIAQENARHSGTEEADREFHLTIARATRNAAIVRLVTDLWTVRARSAPTALLYAKARAANIIPVVEEHRAIVDALRTKDPIKARQAMRAHLTAVLDSLLFATEEKVIEEARKASENRRIRYSKAIE